MLPGFDMPGFGAIGRPKVPQVPQGVKGRGGSATSFISEGGALGGALAGAAAGSVVPVVGTAIGGILGAGVGAFTGRLAENKVRDDRWGVGDAAKEGALSAVLAGPLRLAKYGTTASKAVKGGMTLEKALISGADDAAKFSLRNVAGNAATKQTTKYATKQFGLTDNYISKFTSRYKEDPGKIIQRYGFSNADDVTSAITKQNEVFSSLVDGAGDISKKTVQKRLDNIAMELVQSGPSAQKTMGEKLLKESRQLLNDYDDKIPAKVLNQLKNQYDSLVNYNSMVANPETYGVNKRVADSLRKVIQEASGSNQLKETGMEISKLVNLSDEIAKRAPAVSSRASGPLGFRNLVGGGIGASAGVGAGGAMGGPIGAMLGMGVTAAANSPTGRRAAFKTANAATKALAGKGGAVNPLGMVMGAARGQAAEGMMNDAQQTQAMGLEEALLQQQMEEQQMGQMPQGMPGSAPMGGGEIYPNQTPWLENGISGPLPQQQPQSGITRENILKAMMIDLEETGGKNFSKIQSLYEFANPAPAASDKLTLGAINKISDYDTSLSNLDEVERVVTDRSKAFGPLMGRVRSLNPYDNTQSNINQATLIAAQNIGRSLEGGKLTDQDIARYQKALPNINDTPAQAAQKIARLRSLIAAQKQNYLGLQAQYGGGGGGLEDMLMQQPQEEEMYY